MLLAIVGGCATGGYERYGIYDERHDAIYQDRASLLGEGGLSMAYSVVYWEAISGEAREGELHPEVYYIWLRNKRYIPVTIDPGKISLFTEKGGPIPLSRLTEKTIAPLKRTKLEPLASVGGYVAFDVTGKTMEEDKPNPDDPKVRYFGPGIHRPGLIDLQSGETVYVAGGRAERREDT